MRKPLVGRQLTLPAVNVLQWEEVPEEGRRRAREYLAVLLRDAAVRARRSAVVQEEEADEHREDHA